MIRRELVTVEDYERFIGPETLERLREKAKPLQAMHIAHVNSTYYGGGVAELLDALTLLMNSLGIKTGWRVLHGAPDFFGVTKKIHNALQGDTIRLTERKKEIYQAVIRENAVRNHLNRHDMVVIHDPQPLPMITHYKRKGPWVWHCHVDLTDPNPELWSYLAPLIDQYDAVVMSIPDYRRNLESPQVFLMPGIDPFSIKNRELSEEECEERLKRYQIPTDLPLVVQISRFDRWKDPEGVIRAFKKARKEGGIEATLVLLGNVATDDPEGEEVYESLLDQREERLIVLSRQDTALVNALQRKAAVVLQKSIREGFGLTVTEAMWKRAPVIGGNVGGIRYQIEDGADGFLVDSIDAAAERIAQLIENSDLRREMGHRARETVRRRFLMTRLLEQYLDLFNAFETIHRLKSYPGADVED